LVLVGYPSPVKAGGSHLFTVSAEDAYGNLISGYRGTVHFTSSDPQAALPADYTFRAADTGIHLFHATLNTTGTQSITVTDKSNSKLTSTEGNITVN
jgi:hypothetical protein